MPAISIRFRFGRGDAVVVDKHAKDPGGQGTVTGLEWKEDDRGAQILYRVLIPGHAGQDRAAAAGRRNDGFWYKDSLVREAG